MVKVYLDGKEISVNGNLYMESIKQAHTLTPESSSGTFSIPVVTPLVVSAECAKGIQRIWADGDVVYSKSTSGKVTVSGKAKQLKDAPSYFDWAQSRGFAP